MKQIFQIAVILMAIGLAFLIGIFAGNLMAAAIGFVLIGMGVTILVADKGYKSRAVIYMWIAIIIIDAVLLGLQYLVKDLHVNLFPIA